MSIIDSNPSNNVPGVLLQKQGTYFTDNTNNKYDFSMIKAANDYYIISQSSANFIVFNDVLFSSCSYAFPKKEMYITNISTDFTLAFDRPTTLYDNNGIRLIPASSFFSTQQRILTSEDLTNVEVNNKSLEVYTFSELNKSN